MLRIAKEYRSKEVADFLVCGRFPTTSLWLVLATSLTSLLPYYNHYNHYYYSLHTDFLSTLFAAFIRRTQCSCSILDSHGGFLFTTRPTTSKTPRQAIAMKLASVHGLLDHGRYKDGVENLPIISPSGDFLATSLSKMPLRLLCLHGWGTSIKILQSQLGTSRRIFLYSLFHTHRSTLYQDP
jgi:hypothetical protein